MAVIEGIGMFILGGASYLLFCVPGIMIASLGWWLANRTTGRRMRTVLRAALLSLALMPGAESHLTPVPAAVLLLDQERRQRAMIALLAGWILFLPIAHWGPVLAGAIRGRLEATGPAKS